jgi:hypothetical protein
MNNDTIATTIFAIETTSAKEIGQKRIIKACTNECERIFFTEGYSDYPPRGTELTTHFYISCIKKCVEKDI